MGKLAGSSVATITLSFRFDTPRTKSTFRQRVLRMPDEVGYADELDPYY